MKKIITKIFNENKNKIFSYFLFSILIISSLIIIFKFTNLIKLELFVSVGVPFLIASVSFLIKIILENKFKEKERKYNEQQKQLEGYNILIESFAKSDDDGKNNEKSIKSRNLSYLTANMIKLFLNSSDDVAKQCVSFIKTSNNNENKLDDKPTKEMMKLIYYMRKEFVPETKLILNDLMF